MLVVFELQTHIVQELRRRWSGWLQVPSFVEGRVMASLDDAGSKVDVNDVLVGCGVAKKDAGEVVVVEFSPTVPRTLYTHSRSENS